MGDFGVLIDVGAWFGRLVVIFILRDAFDMGVLLFLISSLIYAVSLWEAFCVVVFPLKISANLLMYCNLASLIDANGAGGAGLEMYSIRYSATLVLLIDWIFLAIFLFRQKFNCVYNNFS